MRTIKYISLFFCLVVAFSCTKPDNESPSDVVPTSVTDQPFRDFEQQMLPEESDRPEPSFINDDGDDESGPGQGSRNPK